MTEPAVSLSIIVPIYNVEMWLEECLASIYRIDVPSFEVILVNDESPDNSHIIIERYANAYPEITVVVNRKNGGLSAARNSGLAVAKGEYIAFIDSDDFIEPDAFTQLVLHTIDAGVDIVCGNGFKYINAEQHSQYLTCSAQAFESERTYTGKEYLKQSFESGIFNNVTAWDKIYKRSLFTNHDISFVEGLYHEDVPFTFTIMFNAMSVRYFNCNFYYYRVREGSIMDSWNAKNAKSWVFILNYLHTLFASNKVSPVTFYDFLAYQIWVLFKKSGYCNKQLIRKTLFKPLSFKKRVRLGYLLTQKEYLL